MAAPAPERYVRVSRVSAAGPRAVQLGVQSLTIESAIDHLIDAAQGVVENQLELARLEVQETVSRVVRGWAMLVLGVFLVIGAAVALAMAGYLAFPPEYPPLMRLLVIAGVAAVLGISLALLGVHRVRSHGGE